MKAYLMVDIASRINQIAKGEGVHALANMNPEPITRAPMRLNCWDMELTFNDYRYIERFNEGMAITDEDIDHIVISLIKTLMTDYFEAKCVASPLK